MGGKGGIPIEPADVKTELNLIDRLEREGSLTKPEWISLLSNRSHAGAEYLFEKARKTSRKQFGRQIYTRGLIEFTNYCKNNCYYCGIRCDNKKTKRYRLTTEEIMACCRKGYELDFRTFVLQGGEDAYFTDARMTEIIRRIKGEFPDCAITLSLGERTFTSYQHLQEAGADRYLLRHETANEAHYRKLHPRELSLKNRKACLYSLKELGYQTGAGFMVGSPGQTVECLAEDLLFLKELEPHMIGIGPFVPHRDTPFAEEGAGSVELTLYLIGLLRLMLPKTLLPATTALSTLDADGQEKGILAGANVIMPNLSPMDAREKYTLYDNKLHSGSEAAEARKDLALRMEKLGYQLSDSRGDYQ